MPKVALPKRTRRVDRPLDTKVEVRMYSTEKAKLAAEAEQRGLSMGDLIRLQLGDLIDAAPPEKKVEKPRPAVYDLWDLLEAVTGLSRGQAMLKSKLGRIALDGFPQVPYPHPYVPVDAIGRLRMDGKLLATDHDLDAAAELEAFPEPLGDETV